MFNNPKKKPDAQTAEEKKVEWKGGTYNKVLHAIDPHASETAAKRSSATSHLFKPEEVNTTETDENKTMTRPDTSRKK